MTFPDQINSRFSRLSRLVGTLSQCQMQSWLTRDALSEQFCLQQTFEWRQWKQQGNMAGPGDCSKSEQWPLGKSGRHQLIGMSVGWRAQTSTLNANANEHPDPDMIRDTQDREWYATASLGLTKLMQIHCSRLTLHSDTLCSWWYWSFSFHTAAS